MSVQVLQGDCIQVMRALKDNSVDSVVTDPPYGLEFMGKDWDSFGKAPTGGASFTKDGMGKGFKALPSFTGSPNPSCRNCGGTQRGNDRKGFKRCRCEKPDFPNSNLKQMRALQEWCQIWAAECLRVLKPGGHLLAFGGTRTYHRMACAIEDAGFEIRDSIHWVYGSGFPKSMDISKAIDKAGGTDRLAKLAGKSLARAIAEYRKHAGLSRDELASWFPHREVSRNWERLDAGNRVPSEADYDLLIRRLGMPDEWRDVVRDADLRRRDPGGTDRRGDGTVYGLAHSGQSFSVTTESAARWVGWGTALKPSHEPIVVARKPLTGTVAANVLEWGTGGINVDGCRVEGVKDTPASPRRAAQGPAYGDLSKDPGTGSGWDPNTGRFPPNLLLTHSAECKPAGTTVVRGDNRQGGAGRRPGGFGNVGADAGDAEPNGPLYGDASVEVWDCVPGCPVAEMDEQSGTKTSGKSKRKHEAYSGESDTGFLRGFSSPDNQYDDTGGASRFFPVFKYQAKAPAKERVKVDGISHPTTKPLGLMRWLVRLVTPPGGVCLDLFAGSGTTGEACLDEGFSCILIEREPDYIKLIRERLGRREPTLWDSLWE